MDFAKKPCPIVDIDGVIASGKQFDLDIVLPEDDRNVIYGVIRDCYKEPVKDAVVKLIEIVCDCGKEERIPVSHTFTDEEGEFVFGPLCPEKKYEINFWVDNVKHIKVCAKCGHEGKCLKGVKLDKCDCFVDDKKECGKHEEKFEHKCCYKDEYKYDYKEDYKEDCKKDCKEECKEDHKPEYKPECKQECKPDCKPDYKPDYKDDCKDDHKEDCKEDCKEECKPECRPNYCCNYKKCR